MDEGRKQSASLERKGTDSSIDKGRKESASSRKKEISSLAVLRFTSLRRMGISSLDEEGRITASKEENQLSRGQRLIARLDSFEVPPPNGLSRNETITFQ